MAKNLPKEVEEYFAAGEKKLLKVVPQADYSLVLYYSDNSVREYSLQGKLEGVCAHLRNPEIFNRVFIDDVGSIAWDIDPAIDSSVMWSNRIDICADAAYIYSKQIN